MSLNKQKQQLGFTLLEVLVALFVLGIGLLGLAHLQVTALKHNQSAEFRSKATILAGGILDAMRANQTGVKAGAYNRSLDDSKPNASGAIANRDLNDWLTQMGATLPGAKGEIDCNGTPILCDITIEWTESEDASYSFLFVGAI